MTDPDGALLSKTQRNMLDDDVDLGLSASRRRTKRTRLRQRLLTGFEDFAYLADPDRFEDRDVELIQDNATKRDRLLDGFKDMVAFMYRVDPQNFSSIVEAGLERGLDRNFPEYTVDIVDIKVRKRSQVLDQARQRMENDEPLTPAQISALLREGAVPPAELQDYVQSHPAPAGREYQHRFRGP